MSTETTLAKARDLVETFYLETHKDNRAYDFNTALLRHQNGKPLQSIERAKNCAIIAINQVLIVFEDLDKNNIHINFTEVLNLWDDVKEKIKTL